MSDLSGCSFPLQLTVSSLHDRNIKVLLRRDVCVSRSKPPLFILLVPSFPVSTDNITHILSGCGAGKCGVQNMNIWNLHA